MGLVLLKVLFFVFIKNSAGKGRHGNGTWRLAGEIFLQISRTIEVLLSKRSEVTRQVEAVGG